MGIEINGTELNDEISKKYFPKNAGTWELSPFEIDATATGVGGHNWTWAVSQMWCTGLGTWNNPYVIEDLTIDGGGSDYCISIRNSDVHFRVENCKLSNTGSGTEDASIKLLNTDNGIVIYNTLSFNGRCGMFLKYSNNNTISENTVNDNDVFGIRLMFSNNNEISGNTALRNIIGIYSHFECNNNTISGNTCNNGEGGITSGLTLEFECNYNRISGNIAKNNLMGITIENLCNNNTIEGNTFKSNSLRGIWIKKSNFNLVSENTVNKNNIGIDLEESNYTHIIENTLLGNSICIDEEDCVGNFFQNNNCDEIQTTAINGYELHFLIGVVVIIFGILIRRQLKFSSS
ncbi:MAG: nitrous oxide reductase family maturation protein NosD [Candidatus Hodarchaeota archaeon]